jgi:hypothetical protein
MKVKRSLAYLISGICIGCGSTAMPEAVKLQNAEEQPKLEETAVKALPVFYLDKVDTMPDYCQIQQGLPGKGGQYCGPASALNALVWLDSNGFSDLIESDSSDAKVRLELAKLLGAKEYMNTGSRGSPVYFFMEGLEKYFKDRGYSSAIEYRGHRYRAKRSSGEFIDTDWLRESVIGNSNIVLNVGFYNKNGDVYTRAAGHYVAVAGYDFRESNKLVIHDPSPRSGKEAKHEYCTLAAIESGSLVENNRTRDAAGRWMLKDLKVRSGSNTAIIDGAIKFIVYE